MRGRQRRRVLLALLIALGDLTDQQVNLVGGGVAARARVRQALPVQRQLMLQQVALVEQLAALLLQLLLNGLVVARLAGAIAIHVAVNLAHIIDVHGLRSLAKELLHAGGALSRVVHSAVVRAQRRGHLSQFLEGHAVHIVIDSVASRHTVNSRAVHKRILVLNVGRVLTEQLLHGLTMVELQTVRVARHEDAGFRRPLQELAVSLLILHLEAARLDYRIGERHLVNKVFPMMVIN